LVHMPNHVLLAETVNHAAVANTRSFWVRLLVLLSHVSADSLRVWIC
jgi:hypothetical protein